MKLVLIIGNTSAPLIYFVNTIHKVHKIDLLIIEKKSQTPSVKPAAAIRKNFSKVSFIVFFEKLVNYLQRKLNNYNGYTNKNIATQVYKNHCIKWFGNDFEAFNPEISVWETAEINSPETAQQVRQISPDMLLVHGSSLVKDNLINLAKIPLNLHWGLSPYYRGVNSTMRALVNWDINNIGVTVHCLSKKIDGGEILGQSRANISAQDTIHTIPLQLTYLGTELMIKAIQKYRLGEELIFKSQDFTKGFLFKNSHWSAAISAYASSIDEDLMQKMLKNPSRGKVDLIELM